MAGLMVGGAFLGAFLNVVFDKLASASPQLVDFIREKNLGPLLERLEENLIVVKAKLNDAEKKQFSDPDVNSWLNKLNDVVYMADDLLDEVSTIAATQKEVTSNLFSRLTENVEKLDRILKLQVSLNLEKIATDNSSSRDPSTSLPDGKIYGRDEDKKAIIELLLDGNNGGEQVAVMPIVGMGGVGKTTLAQMLYNDDNLKQIFNFDFKAWVCVSEPFDIMKVTRTFIEALIPEEASKLTNLNSLQEKLAAKLKGKKFFIILDDVWTEDYHDWNLLKKLLQDGTRGSKVIVTTRSENVAFKVQTIQMYHLRQLSNEDCWSVFVNHACLYSKSWKTAQSLEKIGLEIVNKCKGLPLAAQSLGGLLRSNCDIKDWENVRDSNIWELSESESKIIPSLRISYHYLPSYWKRCFVYCSLYPKDFEFKKNDAILLWMAEDLLPPPKKGKALEDVGHECFDYLVSSSFLQRSSKPWKKGYFGMHDLMHDLATSIGGEFYFRSDDLGEEIKIGSKTRHLSFIKSYNPNSEFFRLLGSAKSLRSFLVLGIDELRVNEVQVPCAEVLSLEYLRVLSFCYFENLCALPDSISGMIHLRYLDLSRTGMESLPESLCSLYNLQTLKLEYCGKLTMLPSGMQNLVNLHYLGIDGTSINEMPKGMGKLKQLQHLIYFIVGMHEDVKIKELGGLSNLGGSFTIEKLENVENGSEALEARMMDKKHIQYLELYWSWYSDEGCMDSQTEMDILCKLEPHHDLESLKIKGYRGTRYPDWVGKPSFHNMTKIKLSDCNNCFTLPSLGRLPSLRELSIYFMKSLVTIDASFFNDSNDGGSLLTVVPFPSLEYLEFENMPCWEVWSCFEQPRAFPLLERLRIINCPKLKGDLPSDLPALEQLEIRNCEQLACSLSRAPAVREIKIHSSCDSLTSLALDTYPNLKELDISKCEILESVSVSQSGDGDGDGALQHLTYLLIERCPNLVSLAREGLAAPSLTKFMVSDCDKLESLPPRMNTLLPNLESLKIWNCPRIESSPEQGGMPPSLREILIGNCEKLVSGLAWPSMDMLTEVIIWGPCDGMKSFPKEGLLPPSLQELYLRDLSSLETLDCKGLLHLTSLQELRIYDCPKLENMAGERLPASLTELHISDCPLLGEQCRTKHPQIWPKISHIHSIEVDFKEIS